VLASSDLGLQDRRRHLAAGAGIVIVGRGRFDLPINAVSKLRPHRD
jgi:hypothetical protein